MTDWQPIETAPKDGTPILGFCGRLRTPRSTCDSAVVMWRDAGIGPGWWGSMPNQILMLQPTHWMPLPTPPTEI